MTRRSAVIASIEAEYPATQTQQLFTEAEEAQIKSTLSLSSANLDTVLSASSYIFEQAAYHNSSDSKLQSGLEAAGVQSSQVRAGRGLLLYAGSRARVAVRAGSVLCGGVEEARRGLRESFGRALDRSTSGVANLPAAVQQPSSHC